jgi:Amino acid transporters
MDINTAVPSAESADNDVKLLHKMGYAQELSRRMGAFSNFAVSFSLICILSGGITSFQMGLSAAGGASIGLGWPLGSLFALVVAAAMAQIASSYPTAGGLSLEFDSRRQNVGLAHRVAESARSRVRGRRDQLRYL